jgi:hypothetical protein
MRTSTRARTATAALIAATVAAGSTGAAAAGAKSFDLTTAKGANKGQAHGYGDITFTGPKKVKITGRINDICPKDGFGAYVEFKVNFVGGGYGTTVRSDTTKCGTAHGVAFNAGGSFPRKIKSVGVTVIEIDNTSSGQVFGDAARKLIGR